MYAVEAKHGVSEGSASGDDFESESAAGGRLQALSRWKGTPTSASSRRTRSNTECVDFLLSIDEVPQAQKKSTFVAKA